MESILTRMPLWVSLPVPEQQQMAEIPKILVRDPELIILDEPTSALAKKEVEQLYQIIHNLIADGKTIIFISHRLEELFELGRPDHRIQGRMLYWDQEHE